MVAAGFGTGSREHPGVRHEVAPVTRYHDQYIADPQHRDEDAARHEPSPPKIQDVEAIVVESASSARSSSEFTVGSESGKMAGKAPLVPSATPFFHFDIAAAVRAAERGAVAGHRSYHTFPEKE